MKKKELNADIVGKFLTTDPIATAEKEFDKHHSQFTDSEIRACIRGTVTFNQAKRAILQQSGDSFNGISFEHFVNLAETIGFKEGYRSIIVYPESDKRPSDTYMVLYREDGLILTCDSYGESLNNAHMFGNSKVGTTEWDFPSCSMAWTGDILSWDIDVREGFIYNLNKIKKSGITLPIWESSKMFCWLINRTEYEHKELSRDEWTKKVVDLTFERLENGAEGLKKIVYDAYKEKRGR